MTGHHDMTNNSLDVFAATIAVAGLLELLPPIATLLTIIWLGLRIFETKTVTRWIVRWYVWKAKLRRLKNRK